jgi:hypothetical protein
MSHTSLGDPGNPRLQIYKSPIFPLLAPILFKLRSTLTLLDMSKRATSISLGKMSTDPPHLVQSGTDKKTVDRRAAVQSLLNGLETFPSPQFDMLVGFPPETCEQGYFGMEMDDVSHRPTFMKTLHVDDVDREYPSMQRTCHPNLLNLTDFSVGGGLVYLNYERPGISLARLKQFKMTDRIAVATILKKVTYPCHCL